MVEVISTYLKVSEYPFKQDKNILKNIKELLYTHFDNISLNVLRSTFFNICNLSLAPFPNIRKIRVKVELKTNYFSYFMRCCTDRIVVFNNFFHWYLAKQEPNKTVRVIFCFFKYFLNNLLLTVFMQNTLSKLVVSLQ